MKTRDVFDSLSAIDFRYWDKDVAAYLSENAFTRYKLRAELALVKALRSLSLCPDFVVDEVARACEQVTTEEVYEEEERIHHDIRALVNCIRKRVSDAAKPYVHMAATSYDIVDTANAARYRDVTKKVLVPALIALEKILIGITLREADTVQIGRTHGQHAVPITFGFALAGYVSRLGNSIQTLAALADELHGKFSGAVGAYNASSLFVDNPTEFEIYFLEEMGVLSAEHSTQVVPPESLTRLLAEVAIVAGILANLSRDMRHLQRTEIGEVGEEFEAAQVGSSTMPQKRNPINFENAESCWKVVMPRMMTVFMDQLSEHQRDLTNSASGRTYGEMIAYVVSMAKRLTRTMSTLKVDRKNLKRNLDSSKSGIAAEPLQIILSALGHPDAHEKVRMLTLLAERENVVLQDLVRDDAELQSYFSRMTDRQRQIIADPLLYTGIAAEKARSVAERWKATLKIS